MGIALNVPEGQEVQVQGFAFPLVLLAVCSEGLQAPTSWISALGNCGKGWWHKMGFDFASSARSNWQCLRVQTVIDYLGELLMKILVSMNCNVACLFTLINCNSVRCTVLTACGSVSVMAVQLFADWIDKIIFWKFLFWSSSVNLSVLSKYLNSR